MIRLIASTITFEPTPAQALAALRQLVDTTDPTSCSVYDNSATAEGRDTVRAACAAAGVAYNGGAGNHGTARALNFIMRQATNVGAEWVLYLDQDSRTLPGHVLRLRKTLNALSQDTRVAAIGCRVRHPGRTETMNPTESLQTTAYCIASGTAYNVRAALDLGGFDEDMFLDTVDHEYCLWARHNGWSIFFDAGREIAHPVGQDSRQLGPSLFEYRVARHPLWRRELMWSNSIVLARRYHRDARAAMAKHLVVRIVDTIITALTYAEFRVVTRSVRGAIHGALARPAQRRGWIDKVGRLTHEEGISPTCAG